MLCAALGCGWKVRVDNLHGDEPFQIVHDTISNVLAIRVRNCRSRRVDRLIHSRGIGQLVEQPTHAAVEMVRASVETHASDDFGLMSGEPLSSTKTINNPAGSQATRLAYMQEASEVSATPFDGSAVLYRASMSFGDCLACDFGALWACLASDPSS